MLFCYSNFHVTFSTVNRELTKHHISPYLQQSSHDFRTSAAIHVPAVLYALKEKFSTTREKCNPVSIAALYTPQTVPWKCGRLANLSASQLSALMPATAATVTALKTHLAYN